MLNCSRNGYEIRHRNVPHNVLLLLPLCELALPLFDEQPLPLYDVIPLLQLYVFLFPDQLI